MCKLVLQAELQEDNSEESILEARATLEDSRLFYLMVCISQSFI